MQHSFKHVLTLLLASTLSAGFAAAGEATAGKDGFKLGEGTDYTLEAHFLTQVRGTYRSGQTAFAGDLYAWIGDRVEVPDAKDTEVSAAGSFRMRRVRAMFNGTAYKPWVKWKLETELYGDKTKPRLLDGYIRLGGDSGFYGQVGQFKAPFDLFVLAAPWKLQFGELPIASSLSPGYDLGGLAGWRSPEGHWLARLAIQNGAGANVSDDNDGKLTSLRVEYQNKDGFGDDRTSALHADDTAYTFGFGWISNQVGGLVSEETGGTCLIGTTANCVYDNTSRTAIELFGAMRTRDLSISASWKQHTLQDGLLTDTSGTTDDKEISALAADAGWFLFDEKVEIVGRYSLLKQKDPGFIAPPLGPDGISDIAVKPSAPPNLVWGLERTRQWGMGFNYYISEHNMKLHFSWTQTEIKNEVLDRLKIYVPDVGLGTPVIQQRLFFGRDGVIYRRAPVWYAMLTFYI